jgi:hypothetical protein
MSDLDDALRRLAPSGPDLAPLPGQVEHASRAVGRRRRTKALAAGGAGLLTAAAVATISTAVLAPSAVTLEQRGGFAGQPTALATADPSATATPTAGSASPSPSPSPAGSGSAPNDVTSASPQPSTSSGPGQGAAGDPTPDASAAPVQRPPVTRTSEQLTAVCGNENGGVGGGTDLPRPADWCLTASAEGGAGDYALAVVLCRNASGPSDLTFRTQQEADFAVARAKDGRELWRWSTGQSFAEQPHSYRLGETDCLRWTVHWDGDTDAGETQPVDTELTLEVEVHGDELEGRSRTEQTRFYSR